MTEPELLEHLSGIKHFLCEGQAYWLYQQAEKLPAGSQILEIGCYHGMSTCALALGGLGQHVNIFTVDNNPEYLDTMLGNVIRLGLRGRVFPFSRQSELVTREQFPHWPDFQFAFIDGDHVAPAPNRDFRNVLKLMAPKARIALHDVTDDWPDVKRLWHEVAAPMLNNHELCGTIACGET